MQTIMHQEALFIILMVIFVFSILTVIWFAWEWLSIQRVNAISILEKK